MPHWSFARRMRSSGARTARRAIPACRAACTGAAREHRNPFQFFSISAFQHLLVPPFGAGSRAATKRRMHRRQTPNPKPAILSAPPPERGGVPLQTAIPQPQRGCVPQPGVAPRHEGATPGNPRHPPIRPNPERVASSGRAGGIPPAHTVFAAACPCGMQPRSEFRVHAAGHCSGARTCSPQRARRAWRGPCARPLAGGLGSPRSRGNAHGQDAQYCCFRAGTCRLPGWGGLVRCGAFSCRNRARLALRAGSRGPSPRPSPRNAGGGRKPGHRPRPGFPRPLPRGRDI